MAHYYDERLRTSDATRSRHGHHHHQGRRSRDPSPEYSRPRDDRYSPSRLQSNTQANAQPNPPRSVTPRPSTPRVPPPSRPSPRATWPPAPKVEDEKVSLAKEANPPSVADSDRSEARSRGSLDQQPIILEAFESSSELASEHGIESRQFGKDSKQSGLRDGGEDPDSSRIGRRMEKAGLYGEAPVTPDLSRRQPSPYVFRPKEPDSSKTSSSDSGYFSSSDVRPVTPTTPTSEKPRAIYESDALRGTGKSRSSSNATPKTADTNEDVLDGLSEVSAGSQGSRNPSRYSFVKSDLTEQDYKASLRETMSKNAPPRVAEVKGEATSRRRSSESTATMPLPRFDLDPAQAGSRDVTASGRSSGSRPSSPVPSTPSASPRVSISQGSSTSGRSSKYGSRPESPVQGLPNARYDETLRRSSTFPVVQDDRSQRTSRLATSTVPSDMRTSPPYPTGTGGALPYPVGDMNLMPSEEFHRYKPQTLGDPFVPTVSSAEPDSKRSSVSSRPASVEIPRFRPAAESRHTIPSNLPTLATAVGISDTRAEGSPTTARDSPISSWNLPPCPRSHSSRSHNDWYTLQGCPNFDICPTCLENFFAKSSFKDYFIPAPRTDPSQKVKCDFSSPWMRLAYTVTLQQRRYNLELIYEMAHIDNTEQHCPGGSNEARHWYTILDDKRHEVHNFDVCPCDLVKIETLMPSINGYFVKSRTAGRKRKCDFRTDSPRFQEYMDLLTEIDSVATAKRKRPDMTPFMELARHKSQMRECSRDDLILDQSWHFAPQLPEFTVCEECYSVVVWPAIAEGSSVARYFNQTPLLVHEEKSNRNSVGVPPPAGTSCQLYSPRMRKVFQKAVDTADFNYLARRARERKDVEMELQSRFASLRQAAADVSKASGSHKAGDRGSWGSQQRLQGLKIEFDKMMAEWQRWE